MIIVVIVIAVSVMIIIVVIVILSVIVVIVIDIIVIVIGGVFGADHQRVPITSNGPAAIRPLLSHLLLRQTRFEQILQKILFCFIFHLCFYHFSEKFSKVPKSMKVWKFTTIGVGPKAQIQKSIKPEEQNEGLWDATWVDEVKSLIFLVGCRKLKIYSSWTIFLFKYMAEPP